MSIEFDLIDTVTQAVVFSSTDVAEIQTRAKLFKYEGRKVRVQKRLSAQDPSVWHAREQARLEQGTYKKLPQSWLTANWFTKGREETKFHFPPYFKRW